MMYGPECLVVDRKIEQWLSGVTREDKIRKEYISDSTGVATLVNEMREDRLR